MSEPIIGDVFTGDPLAGRRAILAAAAQGPTAIEQGTGAIWVLGYRDVEKLLLEPKLHGVGLTLFDHMGIKDGPLRDWYGSLMFTNEGMPHHRLRSLVGRAFSPRAVETLRPIVAGIVAERLERVRADGGGDLVAALADVPMQAMCALLGVPACDVPKFIAWVDDLGPIFLFMTPEQIAAATGAIGQLLEYTEGLCERRSWAPGDDLISALLAAEVDGDKLTRKETAAMVANLLVGGHDTTSSQIACSLLTLLRRPEAMALLREEPALAAPVVNETIRIEPGISAAPRTVVASMEICGVERPAGAIVFCSTMTANRDPEVWRNADDFDARRFAAPDAPKLLSFGGGPHHCLGAWLARLTLSETVLGVANLSPTLTVAADEIAWVQKLGVNPGRLPVKVH